MHDDWRGAGYDGWDAQKDLRQAGEAGIGADIDHFGGRAADRYFDLLEILRGQILDNLAVHTGGIDLAEAGGVEPHY